MNKLATKMYLEDLLDFFFDNNKENVCSTFSACTVNFTMILTCGLKMKHKKLKPLTPFYLSPKMTLNDQEKFNKYCYNKQSASGINPIGALTFNLFLHLSHEVCS